MAVLGQDSSHQTVFKQQIDLKLHNLIFFTSKRNLKS